MPTSIVQLLCPNLKCGRILSVPDIARGKTVRCRNCGMRVVVPAQPPTADAPPTAASPEPPA